MTDTYQLRRMLACVFYRLPSLVVSCLPSCVPLHYLMFVARLNSPSTLRHIVLDESDQMLDMGFAPDVEKIMSAASSGEDAAAARPLTGVEPCSRLQVLLFSATSPTWVKEISRKYLKQPVQLKPRPPNGEAAQCDLADTHSSGQVPSPSHAAVPTSVRHLSMCVPSDFIQRAALLEDLIFVESRGGQTIVFCNTKKEADSLINGPQSSGESGTSYYSSRSQGDDFSRSSRYPRRNDGRNFERFSPDGSSASEGADEAQGVGTSNDANDQATGMLKRIRAAVLHGDIGQDTRDRTMDAFRQGVYRVLIATDVAARGIDVGAVDLIVHMSPPASAELFVHRSGRTGRAGRGGTNVLLYSPSQRWQVDQLEAAAQLRLTPAASPQPSAVRTAAAECTAKQLDAVEAPVLSEFRVTASDILRRAIAVGMTTEEALGRALAAASGVFRAPHSHELHARSTSLLTGKRGVLTVQLSRSRQVPAGSVTPDESRATNDEPALCGDVESSGEGDISQSEAGRPSTLKQDRAELLADEKQTPVTRTPWRDALEVRCSLGQILDRVNVARASVLPAASYHDSGLWGTSATFQHSRGGRIEEGGDSTLAGVPVSFCAAADEPVIAALRNVAAIGPVPLRENELAFLDLPAVTALQVVDRMRSDKPAADDVDLRLASLLPPLRNQDRSRRIFQAPAAGGTREAFRPRGQQSRAPWRQYRSGGGGGGGAGGGRGGGGGRPHYHTGARRIDPREGLQHRPRWQQS
eukprot:GHVT01045321.1.p1 GENE.GHVT01045321.1~~GHVT01045321.1.p1  ORF type:complete len:751 (-),score=131.32 GHVT01045321.1:125-2377(-)